MGLNDRFGDLLDSGISIIDQGGEDLCHLGVRDLTKRESCGCSDLGTSFLSEPEQAFRGKNIGQGPNRRWARNLAQGLTTGD